MNNAPAVFIPIQPEGDGLTLPTLLSLVAHSIVIGFLIYNFQSSEIDTAGSIETVMVSPEQLAEMQSQILANQAAAAAGIAMDSMPSGAINNEPQNPNDMSADSFNPNDASSDNSFNSANSAAPATSQRVPVFLQSDEPSDTSAPILMSQEQQQLLTEQAQEHERNLAEWAAQQEALTNERLDSVEQIRRDEQAQTQEQLKEFKNKENSPPKIERPNNKQRNIEITSGNAGKNYSLSDGQASSSASAGTDSSGSARTSSRSTGAFKSAILSKIQDNLKTPTGTQGLTASLALKLNTRGQVLSAKARGANASVNAAVEKAAMAASPLPIDLDNPQDFLDLTIIVTIE